MTPRSDNSSGLRHAGDDAFQLTVDYVKQETVEPLRGLGRFLYMGIAGSFFLAVRHPVDPARRPAPAADRDGHGPDRDWSWVPYAAVFVLGLAVIGVAVWRITAGPGQAKLPEVVARRQALEQEAQEGAS